MFRLISNADGRPNVVMRAVCRMRKGDSNTELVTQGGSGGIGYLLQEGTILLQRQRRSCCAAVADWTNNVAA